MTEPTTNPRREPSMWHWWPLFISGFLGPPLAHALLRWAPPYAAVAAGFFTMWVVAGLLFLASPPTPSWRFSRWVLGGALGAVCAGLVALIVHW